MHKIIQEAKLLLPELIQFRRTLHQYPEIGFDLVKSKTELIKRLESKNLSWEEFEGSIVVKLGNGGNSALLLRSELDALPMNEESGLLFSSKTPNRAHCCGHDMNAAILLGALILLKKHNIKGPVVGLFQAAEEIGEGAKRLMDADFLNKFNIVSGISMHVNAKLSLGKLGYGKGKMFASNTSFDVVIHGKGSHGARPFEGKDPINIAVQIYNVLNSIVAREVNVFKHNIFSVTSINAGDAYNVIPETVIMKCSLRTYDEESRKYLENRFWEVLKGMESVFDVKIEYTIHSFVPSLVATPDFVDNLLDLAKKIIPLDQIDSQPAIKYGSEDFAFIAKHLKQIASMSIGAGPDKSTPYLYGQHNSKVLFNEEAILYGCALQSWWAMNISEEM